MCPNQGMLYGPALVLTKECFTAPAVSFSLVCPNQGMFCCVASFSLVQTTKEIPYCLPWHLLPWSVHRVITSVCEDPLPQVVGQFLSTLLRVQVYWSHRMGLGPLPLRPLQEAAECPLMRED